MEEVLRSIKDGLLSRFHSWDEICTKEEARLRTNSVVVTFLLGCFFLLMTAFSFFCGDFEVVRASLVFVVLSLSLSALQFLSRSYIRAISYAIGVSSLIIAWHLLRTGGVGGYAFIWILFIPHILGMVLPLRHALVFIAALLLLAFLLLLSPWNAPLTVSYDDNLRRFLFFGLVLISLFVALADLFRHVIGARLNRTSSELSSFAFTDPLTGVYNRRAMVSHIGKGHEDAVGLAFAILDIDYFKKVNDIHGHKAGDAILCHLVKLIKNLMPPNSLLYRWGGEEFVLVAKGLGRKDMHVLLEEIRQAVEENPCEVEETPLPVTVSLGGVWPQRGMTVEECIRRADERLYMAKSGGRNLVCFA